MGRYLSGAGAGSQPRRQIVRLTESNPALQVPPWARLALISACGAGGSGAVGVPNHGGGGGAGGFCLGVVSQIAPGQTTLSVIIGAAALGVTANVDTNGLPGGSTLVTAGSQTLVHLSGGRGGIANSGLYAGGAGGFAVSGNDPAIVGQAAPPYIGSAHQIGFFSGMPGSHGDAVNSGRGVGGYSIFGNGSRGFAEFISTPGVNGNAGRGNGSGGSGTRYVSGAAVSSGEGTPGLAFIEFLEAF